jgi:hypothetical protein
MPLRLWPTLAAGSSPAMLELQLGYLPARLLLLMWRTELTTPKPV